MQSAPRASLAVERSVRVPKPGKPGEFEEKTERDEVPLPLVENDIRADLNLDQRQKGLLWYSTYRVQFSGAYVFENPSDKAGEMRVEFVFPNASGLYDDFKFELDGKPLPFSRDKANLLVARVPCQPKARRSLSIHYISQGLDSFAYRFDDGISEVRNFEMTVGTDFDGYDFSRNTLSPGEKRRTDAGWELTWRYTNLISGSGIGVEMPRQINPGPMASRISFFAPVSLAFFFFLIFVMSLMKGIDLHPVNYFFLAAAFFAFHLLLAYLVDHISIHLAFLICSAVSVFLVLSYMRVVSGNRFAFFESALSQVIYLVGFSYAFFIEGFTGLAVTVGSILTLFVVMQMTAKINWAEKFQPRPLPPTFSPPPPPAGLSMQG